MADPVIIDMTESEFNRIYGGGSGSTPAPTPVGASPSIAPVAPMMAPQQSGGMVQPIIIDMPESEYRMRFGTMGENALQGIKDIPSSIMSIPENLYGVAKGTAGALSTMSAGGEVAPSDKMALRNLGSLAGGTAGGLAGAKAGALMGTPLGPWGMGLGGLAGGAVGGALGLLGVDWAAEQAGVDAPRTTQERLNSLAYNTTQGFGGDVALRGIGAGVRGTAAPFKAIATESGRRQAAANVLRDVIGGDAAQKIDQASQALTGDPLAQYRSTAELLNSEPAAQLEKQVDIGEFGSPVGANNIAREKARKAMLENLVPRQTSIEQVQANLTNQIDNLQMEAAAAEQRLPASIDPTVSGEKIRETAEYLRGQKRLGVKGGFNNIPDKEMVRFAPNSELATAPEALKEIFGPGSEGEPSRLRKMVDTFIQRPESPELANNIQPQPLDLNYLQRLRSWAGEEADIYYKNNKNREGAVASAVVKDVDNLLENAVTDGSMPPDQAKAYRNALAAHKQMVETFEQGPVGGILRGGTGTSGYSVESSAVGRQFWNSKPEAMDNFSRALGGDATANEMLQRDAMTAFRQKVAGESGTIKAAEAQKWIREHQPFLNMFPEVKRNIETLANSASEAQSITKNFGKFAEANPEKAISVIMEGPQSVKKIRTLKRQLGNAPDMTQALARGSIDHLITNAYNIADTRLKPETYRRFVDNNKSFLAEVLSPQQQKVLDIIYGDLSSEAKKADLADRASRNQSATAQRTLLAVKIKDMIRDEFGVAGSVLSSAPKIGLAVGGALGGATGFNLGGTGALSGVGFGGYIGAQIGAKVAQMADRAVNAAMAELAKASADPQFASNLLTYATPEKVSAAMKILNPKLSPIRSLLVTGALITRQDSAKAAQSLANMIAPSMQSYQAIPQQMRDLASAVMQNPSADPTEAPPIIGGAAQRTSTAGDVSIDGGAVDPRLIDAMAMVESSNNPNAVGPRTRYGQAKGRLQLLDSTGKELHKKLGLSGKYDPFDSEQNTTIATAYMGQLADRYGGSIPLALAAYNYGMGNLDNAIARLGQSGPREIQEFLEQAVRDGMRIGMKEGDAKRAAAAALVDTYGPEVFNRYLPKETRNYISKILTIYNSDNQSRQEVRA